MKLALIPPYALMPDIRLSTGIQMVLPACLGDNRYSMYMKVAAEQGDYLILDNGLFEGTQFGWEALMVIAQEYSVKEVILPDTMRDMRATMNLARGIRDDLDARMNYMGVLQGTTYDEFLECADFFAYTTDVTCLGVPKHMPATVGDPYARLRCVRDLKRREYGTLEVHLLGGTGWAHEAFYASRVLRGDVRSMDTSLPYYAALLHTPIKLVEYSSLSRPEGFFEDPRFVSDRNVREVAKDNVKTLLEWCRE